ncbi:hypothetical protein B7R54_08150 [Subtercola boreus]|uniref:YdhG-like domain-containing protein n=1 Tax=Subtercola boreus TaxID=120213 RepID=A0A3E0VHK2_9MICO|nr:hypothetical protein [Subtercola boreus]RFA09201.1 hypothetical protein B7R54_08150 [Subtercola boreus]TQL53779.1 uncharacterized protein YdhG (YjbR/CyaY superfamily) [Subtercola boreus]
MTAEDAASFSAEEKAAMKERAKELKTAARRKATGAKADPLADQLEKIAELPEPDRSTARRIHDIVSASAPALTPKTWYGMPGWARDGKVVVFFQSSAKFSTRYSTLGFNDSAALDEGDMWPTSYAIAELTPEVEARIADLAARAAS